MAATTKGRNMKKERPHKLTADTDLVRPGEAARHLALSLPTLRRMAAAGRIVAVRVGPRGLRYTRESLEALVKGQRGQEVTP